LLNVGVGTGVGLGVGTGVGATVGDGVGTAVGCGVGVGGGIGVGVCPGFDADGTGDGLWVEAELALVLGAGDGVCGGVELALTLGPGDGVRAGDAEGVEVMVTVCVATTRGVGLPEPEQPTRMAAKATNTIKPVR
jgi:hypothetical protein